VIGGRAAVAVSMSSVNISKPLGRLLTNQAQTVVDEQMSIQKQKVQQDQFLQLQAHAVQWGE